MDIEFLDYTVEKTSTELQKELDDLKASLPKIKSDVLTEFADEMLKCAHISNDDRYRFVAKRARGYAGQLKQGANQ